MSATEQHGQVARQAACYQGAMEQLVRLDIPKALPILANYLTVMSDLIVHPDARWKNVDEDRCVNNVVGCVNNVVGCVNNVDVNDAGDHSADAHGDKSQPRYLDCEEAYKQCLWLENRGYKVLKEHQVNKDNL